MYIERISRIGVIAGCCSAALLFIGVATSASSTSSTHQGVVSSVSVKRAGKADQLTPIKSSPGAMDAIAIELTGPADLVIRDRDGNILYAVDHTTRTTTVGKKRRESETFPNILKAGERALPDGCEGAFSPYVEPAKAHIIGRCVSGVFLGNKVFV
jgi:hypothetical protein